MFIAEDGIRDFFVFRGVGNVYKKQGEEKEKVKEKLKGSKGKREEGKRQGERKGEVKRKRSGSKEKKRREKKGREGKRRKEKEIERNRKRHRQGITKDDPRISLTKAYTKAT